MAHGFQVFNADGSLQFDLSSRLFRVLTVSVTTANGSVTDPRIASGEMVIAVNGSRTDRKAPVVIRSGNTVSWDYSSIPVAERDTSATITMAVF